MYPSEIVFPIKQEMLKEGFIELDTPQKVNENMNTKDSILLFVNSICGCAAGSARPALFKSLKISDKVPQKLYTVFAGYDIESVDLLRKKYLTPFPPSSPCIAIFKNSSLIYMFERYNIEGNNAEDLCNSLMKVYKNLL